jgi:hypothetical protein
MATAYTGNIEAVKQHLVASGVRQAVCNLLRFLRADLTFSKTSFALAVHMNG